MMKRGEIYYAALDPAIGSETQKNRPVLIISNDANNQVSDTITIIPITSKTQKIYFFEVFLEIQESGLSQNSKAQCQQIRTISKQRIKSRVALGKLSIETMQKIQTAVKLHLALT